MPTILYGQDVRVRTPREEVLTFPEGASQSFKRGDFLILSGGYVVLAKAAGNLSTGKLASELILGQALMDAKGVQGTPIQVVVANECTDFAFQVVHSTDASSVLTVALLGEKHNITHLAADAIASGKPQNRCWVCQISGSLDNQVVITGFVEDVRFTVPGHQGVEYSATGEKYGLVWARFLPGSRVV